MKILIVSDREEPYIWDYFDRDRFKDVGLVLSCGDVKAEYLSFLVTMIKAPLFYVHGNHDADYAKNPPEGCISIEDSLVVHNGLRIVGLGGSMLYNGNIHQYTEEQMLKRIKRLAPRIYRNKGFDILLAHAPAYGLGDGKDLCHHGFQSFLDLMAHYRPRYFIHGHQHLTYGIRQKSMNYEETTIIKVYGYHLLDY